MAVTLRFLHLHLSGLTAEHVIAERQIRGSKKI